MKHEKRITLKRGHDSVVCVVGGRGFEEGAIYPVLDYNNGVQIARSDVYGDPLIDIFFNIDEVIKGVDSDSPTFVETTELLDYLDRLEPEEQARWYNARCEIIMELIRELSLFLEIEVGEED